MIRLTQIVVIIASTVLLLSGYAKVIDTPAFAESLSRHGLIPSAWVAVLGDLFPLAEVSTGTIALWWTMVPHRLHRAGMCLGAMYGVLGAYAAAMWWHPSASPAPCGCGFTRVPVENWLIPAGQSLGVALVTFGLTLRVGALEAVTDGADRS